MRTLESGSKCCVEPDSYGEAIITCVNFGLRTNMNNRSKGIEHIIDTTVIPPSASINPNKDNTMVCTIMYNSNTIPSILQITLQGDDLDARAKSLGGGVRGAMAACIRPLGVST